MNVARGMAIDLADEAQGEVQLVVILPAGAGHAAHQFGEEIANPGWRTDCGEQPVHLARLVGNRRKITCLHG